jgi:hypothetical protein
MRYCFFVKAFLEISEKVQKSLIPPLPAPPSVGTGAGRQGLGTDYTDTKCIEIKEICLIESLCSRFQSSFFDPEEVV